MKKIALVLFAGAIAIYASGFVVLRAAKRGDDVAREWRVGTGNTVQ